MATFTWTGAVNDDWNGPANWDDGLSVSVVVPNDAAAVVTDDIPGSVIISGGTNDTVASLNVTGLGHVIVGGSSALGGEGVGTLISLGSISVTGTFSGGGLVGALGAIITAPTLTIGVGAIVGGGGTFTVESFINNGIIQADGSEFGLGPLDITGGTISGSGSIEIDSISTLELGSTTAQTILVNVASPPTLQVATIVLDDSSTFTGTIDLFNPNTYLDLILNGITADAAVLQGSDLVLIQGTTTVATVHLADDVAGEGVTLTGSTVAIAPTSVVGPVVAPTLASAVINEGAPIRGTADPGSAVMLLSGGVAIGSATADANGVFAVVPSTPLSLGPNSLSATETVGAATSAQSAPANIFNLQAPVNGISSTDFSSAVLGAALGQGAGFSFISGTEAILLTDSTLSVGPDTNEATIQRLYEGLLGRSDDSGGISYFDSLLTAGVTKATIAEDILGSNEYAATHGTLTDEQFVVSLYQGMLGRSPDPVGEGVWNATLAQGTSRGAVAAGFADSDEAKAHLGSTTAQVYVPNAAGTLVHELYETGLGREVEVSALPFYQAAYQTQTASQIAASIANSGEFAAYHNAQDNAAFIESLYQAGLGRAADPDGLAVWSGQLASGGTRGDVLLGIATSSEAAAHLTHNLSAS